MDKERKKLQVLTIYRKHGKKSDENKACNDTDKTVKVKGLQPPVFSGEIREYPNFREDYKRLSEGEHLP